MNRSADYARAERYREEAALLRAQLDRARESVEGAALSLEIAEQALKDTEAALSKAIAYEYPEHMLPLDYECRLGDCGSIGVRGGDIAVKGGPEFTFAEMGPEAFEELIEAMRKVWRGER